MARLTGLEHQAAPKEKQGGRERGRGGGEEASEEAVGEGGVEGREVEERGEGALEPVGEPDGKEGEGLEDAIDGGAGAGLRAWAEGLLAELVYHASEGVGGGRGEEAFQGAKEEGAGGR